MSLLVRVRDLVAFLRRRLFSVGRSSEQAYRPCVPLLGAIAGGIVLGRETPLTPERAAAAAFVLLATWRWSLAQRRPRVASYVLLAAVLLATAAWSYDRWQRFRADELALSLSETSTPVTIEALVRRGPRFRPAPPPQPLASIPRGDETQLLVSVERLRDGGRWRAASGAAVVSVEGHVLGVHAGDRIRLHGWGSIVGPPLNPGQGDFAAHLRGQRQLCRLQVAHPDAIQLLRSGSPYQPRRVVDEMRRRGQIWLQRHLPPHESGLALAVLLGVREELDEDRSDAFFQSGLAHLLAVSGLNVAIFAYGFWFIARLGLIPRRPAIVLVATLAVLYALLTDAEPPVLRAALLVVGSAAGRLAGRNAAGENTLAGAACLVLLFDPASLFHAGAQLSFLAVAVLDQLSRRVERRVVEDPLERLLARGRSWPERLARHVGRWMWEGFTTSAIVWLVTLPLVWYRFHVISPIALALNPLVMLPMSLAMYSGALALAIAGFWPGGGDLCGGICSLCLRFIEGAIGWGLRVPGNHAWLPAPPTAWIVVFYLALAATIWEPNWRPGVRWRCVLWSVWLASAFLAGSTWRWLGDESAPRRTGEPRVTFIAVGHGTAVLIELPDGRAVLYDGGRLGHPAPAARAIAGTLWSKGLRRLDAVIISHADTDHYNAIPELAERFGIDVVYVSPVMFRDENAALSALRTALRRTGIPLRELMEGDRLWPDGPTTLAVWHPGKGAARGSDNSHSIVLAIEQFGRRVLLPGDLESPGLDELLAGPPRPCEAIMAPHHGSVKSKPSGFAAWTTPRYVIVSGSRSRDDPALRRAYESAGCHVLHTGQDGAVEVLLRRDGVRAEAWRRR